LQRRLSMNCFGATSLSAPPITEGNIGEPDLNHIELIIRYPSHVVLLLKGIVDGKRPKGPCLQYVWNDNRYARPMTSINSRAKPFKRNGQARVAVMGIFRRYRRHMSGHFFACLREKSLLGRALAVLQIGTCFFADFQETNSLLHRSVASRGPC
jgi:hypothetical protein